MLLKKSITVTITGKSVNVVGGAYMEIFACPIGEDEDADQNGHDAGDPDSDEAQALPFECGVIWTP